MNILYLSVHSILEADEVQLFTELGHSVFSFGSYMNPQAPHDPKRPPIKAEVNDYLIGIAIQCSQENLHERLIAWADTIIIMHRPDWVLSNWQKIKHKRVILRTIGQNTQDSEMQLSIPRLQGLEIVRYSPMEERISGYVGHDAIIRFYKDPDEFTGYTGTIPAVLTVAQSMKERGDFCGYDIFREATEGFERNLYGVQSKNPDLTPMDDPLWRGQLSFEDLKKAYREHQVYLYTGTYPASYVLNFIEAFMTGIPIVAIGRNLANLRIFAMDSYEVDSIIEHGVNGFLGDSIAELREHLFFLKENPSVARQIGKKGREKAIELFGKETIKNQWKSLLG